MKNSDYHAQMSKLTEKVVQSLPEEVPDITGPFHPENLVKMKVYNMTFTKLRRVCYNSVWNGPIRHYYIFKDIVYFKTKSFAGAL